MKLKKKTLIQNLKENKEKKKKKSKNNINNPKYKFKSILFIYIKYI